MSAKKSLGVDAVGTDYVYLRCAYIMFMLACACVASTSDQDQASNPPFEITMSCFHYLVTQNFDHD